MMKQCPQLKFDKCDHNERKPDNNPPTQVKSNSAHFNGDKVGSGKDLLSGDSSCRIMLAKDNSDKAILQQKYFSPNNWAIHMLKGHAKLINQSTRHNHTQGIFMVTKNKADVDMIDFIFMEQPIPDVFER